MAQKHRQRQTKSDTDNQDEVSQNCGGLFSLNKRKSEYTREEMQIYNLNYKIKQCLNGWFLSTESMDQ